MMRKVDLIGKFPFSKGKNKFLKWMREKTRYLYQVFSTLFRKNPLELFEFLNINGRSVCYFMKDVYYVVSDSNHECFSYYCNYLSGVPEKPGFWNCYGKIGLCQVEPGFSSFLFQFLPYLMIFESWEHQS